MAKRECKTMSNRGGSGDAPSKGAPMACAASPLDVPLHPDLSILAQRGRKLLRQAYAPAPRGVFRSVIDLQVAINRFVADTNLDPKPFVWTADPKRVLDAVKRGKQTVESVHSHDC
jgi:hypothetical protein